MDATPPQRSLFVAFVLFFQTTLVVSQVVVGLAVGSLVLVAGGAHAILFVVSLLFGWPTLRRQHPSGRTMQGFDTASLLAGVASAVGIVFASGIVVCEAIGRMLAPRLVAPVSVTALAVVGLISSTSSTWLLARRAGVGRNAARDAASSALVPSVIVATGVVTYVARVAWLDPVVSIALSCIVLRRAWSLLRRTVDIAMFAVPAGIDAEKVAARLRALPSVVSVHELRLWSLSTTECALSAHLVLTRMPSDELVCLFDKKVRDDFPIQHVTLQLEPRGAACQLAPTATR